MLGESTPVSLSRDDRFLMCLLKYSSTLSMKMATGVAMVRSRGTRRLLVSLTHLKSSLRGRSRRFTKWSITLRRLLSSTIACSRPLTRRSSTISRRLRVATAIAISQTFDHGSTLP